MHARLVLLALGMTLLANFSNAFLSSPAPNSLRKSVSKMRSPSSLKMKVELLKQVETLKVLTALSRSGLLSKIERAGLLSQLEKQVHVCTANDIVGYIYAFAQVVRLE